MGNKFKFTNNGKSNLKWHNGKQLLMKPLFAKISNHLRKSEAQELTGRFGIDSVKSAALRVLSLRNLLGLRRRGKKRLLLPTVCAGYALFLYGNVMDHYHRFACFYLSTTQE
jgi:hypothetical protein